MFVAEWHSSTGSVTSQCSLCEFQSILFVLQCYGSFCSDVSALERADLNCCWVCSMLLPWRLIIVVDLPVCMLLEILCSYYSDFYFIIVNFVTVIFQMNIVVLNYSLTTIHPEPCVLPTHIFWPDLPASLLVFIIKHFLLRHH